MVRFFVGGSVCCIQVHSVSAKNVGLDWVGQRDRSNVVIPPGSLSSNLACRQPPNTTTDDADKQRHRIIQ